MNEKYIELEVKERHGLGHFQYPLPDEVDEELSEFWNEYGSNGAMMVAQPVWRIDGWVLKCAVMPAKYAEPFFIIHKAFRDEANKEENNDSN